MAKRIPYITLVLIVGLLLAWIYQGSREKQDQKQTLSNFLPLQVEYLQGPAVEQGRPMLIDFWATWCAPCRATIPHMNQIYARFKDEGLQVVGITMEDAETVSSFLKDFPMHYSIARDAAGTYFDYLDITGIPHLALVDASGAIVWRGHPMQLSESRMESILNEFKAAQSDNS